MFVGFRKRASAINSIRFATIIPRPKNCSPTPFAQWQIMIGSWIVENLCHITGMEEIFAFIVKRMPRRPYHVDAHRTTAYVPGRMFQEICDHTMYSTSSMCVRSIILVATKIQYDAAAIPMWRAFTNIPDLSPFHLCLQIEFE